jgi:hypothetical protein
VKKLIASLLAIALVASLSMGLVGCGKGNNSGKSGASGTTTEKKGTT